MNEGQNCIIEQTLGKRQASNVGTFFKLLLSYLMKRIPTKDQPVLAAIMMYVHNNSHSNKIFIPGTAADICWKLIKGNQSIRKNLPCPHVNIYGKGFAYVSLYDIIEYTFFGQKIIFLIHCYHCQPRSETPCGRNCYLVL